MTENSADRVVSSKSIRAVIAGQQFSIQIHRPADEERWTLEVVDDKGNSHVWKQRFVSDEDARGVALHTLEALGAVGLIGSLTGSDLTHR